MAQTYNTNITVEGRFSFLTIWEPRLRKGAKPGEEPKYSASLMIPKGTKAGKKTKNQIDEAVEEAKEYGGPGGKCAEWRGDIPSRLKMEFLQDGDDKEVNKKNIEYKGHWILRTSSKEQPGIVDEKGKPILDKKKIKSGDYGAFNVNFFPFDNGSNGVSCGLNHIMKLEDGESLSGRQSADQAFANYLDNSDGDDDGSDLM